MKRSSENMLVRPNSDGTYSATWTPGSVGWYSVLVTIDGYDMEEVSTIFCYFLYRIIMLRLWTKGILLKCAYCICLICILTFCFLLPSFLYYHVVSPTPPPPLRKSNIVFHKLPFRILSARRWPFLNCL